MRKIIGATLMMMAVASMVFAIDTPPAPEISTASAAGALTLLSGALLVVRSRRKK